MNVHLPLSILDLAPVGTGGTPTASLRNTVELARLGERLGYVRYWLAEHHGMPGIASSSPEILINHVATRTERIRVGSGGIMLPNHAPLRIAEAFHTLEALHPGRIDLGMGRAPGSDPTTAQAMRPFDANKFPEQVSELLALSRRSFPEGHAFRNVHVVPTDVQLPPVWLLGSSGAGARLAASLGLGYGYAAHFSPTPPGPALRDYRDHFQPSELFSRPHAILALAVVCAESDEEADHLARSMDLAWVRLRRGEFGLLPSPEEATAYPYQPDEQALVQSYRALLVTGGPDTVRRRIGELIRDTGADEIIVSSMIHDPAARFRSYELLAQAFSDPALPGP